MNNVNFAGLDRVVADKIAPMVEAILKEYGANIDSFHLVGSAVVPDYNEKLSDINSVVVLRTMNLRFIEFLAPLGKKFGRKRIAAPLVMTPEYISGSLDVFPIGFLDFKLIHKTVYGNDLLRDLELARPNVRLQCEREIKTKLLHLRQGYISSLGEKKPLTAALTRSITGSMALFRAILWLLGKEPPILRAEVLRVLGSIAGIDIAVFEKLLLLKTGLLKPSERELTALFEDYYTALEYLGKTIDELTI